MDESTSIYDSISGGLKDLVGLYSSVEAVKLQNQLAKAAASRDDLFAVQKLKNEQAYTDMQLLNLSGGGVSPWLIGGGVLVAALVVFMIVKD